MRQAVSLVLIGFGAFAIALGLFLRFYAYPALAVVPLEQKVESVAEGRAAVFYASDLTLRRDVALTATRRVESNLKRPDVKIGGDVMVWDAGLLVTDSSGRTVSAQMHRVCLDRRTNAAVQTCSESYVTERQEGPSEDDKSVRQEGISYKFPFGVERTGYQYFDTTLRKATEARFESVDTVEGLEVYKFVQRIPPTKLRTQPVPGSLLGLPDASVDADRYHENTRTMWVEPVTGIIVKGQEEQKQTLRGPDGSTEAILLQGTLTFTQDTVDASVARAQEGKSKLVLISWTGPLVLISVGVVLAFLGIFGFIAARRGRKRRIEGFQPQHLA